MRVVFFTIYNKGCQEMGDGLVKSIRRFYPDVYHFDCGQPFSLKKLEAMFLAKGKELLSKYDRIVYIDSDSIMCSPCTDFFGDFNLGCVQNNVFTEKATPDQKDDICINNGLIVCDDAGIWQDYTEEYEKRNKTAGDNIFNAQNALNYVYHTTKKKTKLLEFPDKSYGITGQHLYHEITYHSDGYFYLYNRKRLCIFHAAGDYWKINNIINYDKITDQMSRLKLKGLTC